MSHPLPLAIEIEINSDCNLSCAYCPNSKTKRTESGSMSKDLFLKILTELSTVSYSGRISFHFYNEPTLSPNLEAFIKLTRELVPKAFIDIFSNGVLLTKEKIQTYIDLGVNKFTITNHIGTDLSHIESALQSLSPNYTSKIQLNSYKKINLTNRGGLLNIKNKNHTPPLKIPCFIPRCALVITVNGNVVPCYEDYHQKNAMGNIHSHSLLEIWNSEKYSSFREKLKIGKRNEIPVCKDCNNAWVIS